MSRTVSTSARHIVVVGAGIIGICCASRLQRDGWRVTLIDPLGPGEATSAGNAGGFAVSEIVPLSGPGILRQVPGWLLDPLGPLAIRWRYLPQLAPWLWRFWRAGTPPRTDAIMTAMAALMRHIYTDYAGLIEAAGLQSMLRREGALALYDSAGALARDGAAWQARRRHGVRWQPVSGARLRQLEPALAPDIEHAIYVPDWSHVTEPYRFTHALADTAFAAGVQQVAGRVTAVDRRDGRASAVRLDDGRTIACDAVVIAAGAWSGHLARRLGTPVPLASERGYHVTLPRARPGLSRFIVSAGGGFVILPMAQGIRVAGTVELASLTAPANERRAWVLLDKARRLLPALDAGDASIWMGHRPALPDTLPVIGSSPVVANVHFAFGHGHLGLTLAATTGRLIASLAAGRDPGLDLRPYRIDRF